MKRLLCVAAAAAIASLSLAQSVMETPTNLGLRLGFAYPLDADTRDIVKTFLGVGADLYLNKSLIPGKNTETTFSLDWLGKSSNGAKGNMFPILINQRWYSQSQAEMAQAGRSYFFAGVGAAVLDFTSTKTVFAARGGFGYELNSNVYGEATLLYTEPNNGLRGSALTLHLGYRF